MRRLVRPRGGEGRGHDRTGNGARVGGGTRTPVSSGAPVILLAFAKDSGEHLKELETERDLVSDRLQP